MLHELWAVIEPGTGVLLLVPGGHVGVSLLVTEQAVTRRTLLSSLTIRLALVTVRW